MWILKKLFGYLFSNHKNHIYTALGYEEYFKIVNKLESARISFRTVPRYSFGAPVRVSSPRHHQMIPYEIYVKSEDEYKAREVIQSQTM